MDATELAYAGAARQAQMVRDGECTAREVVQATLDRIAQVDPLLNAYRVVFAESALEQADAVDASGGGSAQEKPLLGVPVPVKDDTDVAGERTAWGSLATDRRPASQDADMVVALREAGAIIIGKTNVPELTIWPLCESLAFGSTRNPWNPDFTSGGSSGGAGAAAAAGLCGVAHGSDGAGSVRIPASFNGLFGLKPQRDRISLGPNHHDGWNGLTVYGPLARSVLDAALFMDAAATDGPPEGFAAAAQADPGSLRVAVSVGAPPGALTRLGADQLAAVRETAEVLRSLGHQVFEREIRYPQAAFLTTVARYLRSISDDVSGLPHPERLERRTRNMARLGSLVGDARLAQARAAEPAVAAGINAIFDEADVVLMPGPAARPFEVGELHGRGALWTLNAAAAKVPWYGIWNTIGQPAASLPAGFDDLGLPLSAQLGGRPGDEVTLLQLAWQVEQASPWVDRRPPLEPAYA